ncbi:MAG: Gfo/Idh/MocA family oxidoreductase [Trueperaceae bacterium]|nr:Gfo/Idh/MocA family oxidoreductase [Trueperaceae bacterium]
MTTPLRYGVIGLGQIVEAEHLPVLNTLSDVKVVAAAEARADRYTTAEQILGHPLDRYDDYHDLLARNDLDAVLVATPNDSHASITRAALAAGKHVFLEKPMATTLQDAWSLVEAQRGSGLAVQVGYVFRYSHLFRRCHELIQDGAIGTPQIAWCHEFRRAMPGQWRYRLGASGGAFVEKNCHHFDLFNWLLGQNVSRAVAFGGQAQLTSGTTTTDILGNTLTIEESEIPDNANIALEFAEGARATLLISFFASFRHRLELGVFGDQGLIVVHEDRREIELQRGDGPSERFSALHPEGIDEPVHHGSVEQHRDFVRAVRGEKEVYCDLLMGYAGLLPAFMAERSLKSGSVVDRWALEAEIS